MFKPASKRFDRSVRSTGNVAQRRRPGFGTEYRDNRQASIAQMKSNSAVVQRKLTMTGGFDVDFDNETDDSTIMEFAEFLLEDDWEYADREFTKEAIFTVLRKLADDGDNTMSEIELKDYIFSTKEEEVQTQIAESGSDDVEEQKETDVESNTIKIGKRIFNRDEWHYTIKETIKNTIGVKELSLLAYKDSKHHNFDFWIGRDDRIWVGGNNTGGKEIPTDYILTEENKVERI